MDELPEFYGRDLYMGLLHGNFVGLEEIDTLRFLSSLKRRSENATNSEVLESLRSGEWRQQLPAAWFAGVRRLNEHLGTISELLLASRTYFVGQGLCFALARFENEQSANSLRQYLAEYLPVGAREYDQQWAIGALAWLDSRLSTTYASAFMDSKLWEVEGLKGRCGCLDPEWGIERVASIMKAVESHEKFA